jgi:hypothetical protein
MKTNKALFINVETKTIETIFLSNEFQSISKAIGNGCQYFCCPYSFSNDDSIYADDEALLRMGDIKGGFVFEGLKTPIVGNAVILGTDSEGDSVDAKSNPDELLEQIVFIDETMAKDYATKVMNSKPIIFGF